DKINNNYRSIYNLPYQYTIQAKVLFGRKVMRYKQWEMDHIADYLKTHANGGAILDMGCSTGHMVEILSNHFGANRIHGADIHIDLVKRNRKVFKNNQFHHVQNGFYEGHEGRYSVVTLMHVLEHVDYPVQTLKKIQSLLSDNGVLVLSVPQDRIRGDSAIFENVLNVCRGKFANVHVRNYKYGSLQKDVNGAGLEIISHRYIHCYRENSNKERMGNYSLILYTKKVPNKNGA
ncbi:MAG: class I SAM-dependent methyltransferase, partial [Candidatus Marinimicrobia bacterium]|nr:class I SAM-dependent methyltransferase [Candidatus Neomarinimicrobiota bacterium]